MIESCDLCKFRMGDQCRMHPPVWCGNEFRFPPAISRCGDYSEDRNLFLERARRACEFEGHQWAPVLFMSDFRQCLRCEAFEKKPKQSEPTAAPPQPSP